MKSGTGVLSLGVDIGGTFTDIVAYNDTTGAFHTHKELTTPRELERGVIEGLRHLFQRESLNAADVHRVVHATTLFANAMIERKGAATGLITTSGFRDILEIGSERKYELYDLFLQLPPPLVRRSLRREVVERIAASGQVEIPLDIDGLADCTSALIRDGVTSIAIVFLHAYANPIHERQAREFLNERFPQLPISISSDISPQIREYERSSTTVANAYIKPIADQYLDRLSQGLKTFGTSAQLLLMLSNGGLTNVGEAKRKPIEMLESGPAAGALAGSFFGARSATADMLAFDMGGTTAKLAMIEKGQPNIACKFEAARQKRFAEGSGLPITISTVELIEIGAGGGSIAGLDALGLMKVGPESASSDPGPACYQRGGQEPTVTDANLILGYLNPDFFAGGTIPISRDAAARAIKPLSMATALSETQTAWGIHNVVNENMASAARVHVAEKGKDPRRYALLTTGGGGPMHGCEVARKLGITKVICPPSAGVASAIGLLVAPARIDRVATVPMSMNAIDWLTLEDAYQGLEVDARRVLQDTGLQPDQMVVERFADIRYIGQGFELVVPTPRGPYQAASLEPIRSSFEQAYREIFSRTPLGATSEIVNIRVSASAVAGRNDLQVTRPHKDIRHAEPKGKRQVYFGMTQSYITTPVYDRRGIPVGHSIFGPAVIEEPESTLIVPPGAAAVVEEEGNIVVSLSAASANRVPVHADTQGSAS